MQVLLIRIACRGLINTVIPTSRNADLTVMLVYVEKHCVTQHDSRTVLQLPADVLFSRYHVNRLIVQAFVLIMISVL